MQHLTAGLSFTWYGLCIRWSWPAIIINIVDAPKYGHFINIARACNQIIWMYHGKVMQPPALNDIENYECDRKRLITELAVGEALPRRRKAFWNDKSIIVVNGTLMKYRHGTDDAFAIAYACKIIAIEKGHIASDAIRDEARHAGDGNMMPFDEVWNAMA